jgi:hypothetical protein
MIFQADLNGTLKLTTAFTISPKGERFLYDLRIDCRCDFAREERKRVTRICLDKYWYQEPDEVKL